jgi:5-formyltetrahydrofolate cyclo-ligase
MIKSRLRKAYLRKQGALSREQRAAKSERIAFNFFSSFDLSRIRYLHCFISIERFNEVNTRPIIELLWSDFSNIQTVVPRVDFESNEMASLTFRRDTQLVRNAWSIDEPSHSELVADEEIDMVLVPGLCFDRNGHRVGYGKGYYDRFLKKVRPDCLKVGLSYFEPVDKIDVHEGDVSLDAVVTPYDVTRGRGDAETT